MRKLIFAIVLFVACAIPVSASELHVIALSQDDTEIDISIDSADWRTKELKQGLNYLEFKTNKLKPTVEVISYGDTIPLKTVQGKSGDWYSIVRLAPPVDGDSEDNNGYDITECNSK